MKTATSSARATRGVLNSLIVACHDDIRVQGATADLVSGERRRRLDEATQRSEGFVEELEGFVRQLGGRPAHMGSPSGVVHEWAQKGRAILAGTDHIGDRYARCARVEAKTAELYEGALQTPLPDAMRLVVERQLAALCLERDDLRRRSILG